MKKLNTYESNKKLPQYEVVCRHKPIITHSRDFHAILKERRKRQEQKPHGNES